MITVFNRREILTTFSQEEFVRAKESLAQAKINFCIRIINQESAKGWGSDRRGTYGSLGMNQPYTKQYLIYVHRKDYDEASAVIRY